MLARLVPLACALMLAGCTTTSTPAPTPAAPPPSSAPQYVTPSSLHMPSGEGCSGELARFHAVMDNDLATGHVGEGVYKRVLADLKGADAACQSGNSGAAMSQLGAVKARYGYP